MTMPNDLAGKIRHVYPASPQQEVLLAMAQEIELLKAKVFCGPQAAPEAAPEAPEASALSRSRRHAPDNG